MSTPHVKDITDYLRKNAVPALMAGRYMAIAHPDHTRGIKDASDFLTGQTYNGIDKLYASEVGEWAGVRFVEENNALASPSGNNTAGFAEAIYFGSDNVVMGVAEAPQIRFGIPQGYGRSLSEASYFVGGFSLVWRYDTDGGEEHEVYCKSS
jgi:N4-gp56 family major capsid protein